MDKEQKRYICEKLKYKEAKAGDTIIKQGDAGDEFFIIIKGTVSVFVNHKPSKDNQKNDIMADTSDDDEYNEFTWNEYAMMSSHLLKPIEDFSGHYLKKYSEISS